MAEIVGTRLGDGDWDIGVFRAVVRFGIVQGVSEMSARTLQRRFSGPEDPALITS
ncbi:MULTISPECIES: hypothetical protein [Streptomyces]|uniref:hypothetical protein n=1 Tax=Streptomyces TaxID=1883 RepID=UPI003433E1E2